VAEGYHGLYGKLVERFGTKGDALYTFVACLLSFGVSGLAAYVFKLVARTARSRPALRPSHAPCPLVR
jgi:hypothetical protein